MYPPDTAAIALVLPSLGVGGAERAFMQLAQGFSAKGLITDLVVCEARGRLQAALPDGVRLHDLKSPHVVQSVRPLAAYLRRARPSAVLSAIDHTNAAVAAAAVLARSE